MGAMIEVVEEIAATVKKQEACAGRFDSSITAHNRKEFWGEDGEEEIGMGFLLAKHILPMGMVELMNAAAKAIAVGTEAVGWTGAAVGEVKS